MSSFMEDDSVLPQRYEIAVRKISKADADATLADIVRTVPH